jgi:hypothetical protein
MPMFTKATRDLFMAILIALSVASIGIVFAETVANSINHTYNPFSQAQEQEK